MPFVTRDKNDRIIALYRNAQQEAEEELSPTHPEVISFLFGDEESSERRDLSLRDLEDLHLSDLGLVRVIEDLIGVLIDKHVITLTDLPEPAIMRLRTRQKMRQRIEELTKILNPENKVF